MVIAFDLSNPNLINPIYLGDEVRGRVRKSSGGAGPTVAACGARLGPSPAHRWLLQVLFKLRRPWWFELQGRYGNLF